MQAAEKLQVTWSPPKFKLPANPEELYALLKNTKSFTTLKASKKAMQRPLSKKQTSDTKQAYRWPFQIARHDRSVMLIADVRGDQATIWSGCQGPFRIRAAVASLLKIPEKNVRVIYRDGLGLLWPSEQ